MHLRSSHSRRLAHSFVSVLLVFSACQDVTTSSGADSVPSTADGTDALLPRCETIRPEHEVAGQKADGTPLTLPLVRTQEPCDGVDNDGDGFTDPHCGNVPCRSDADCTYGGLLPDADCNSFQHLVEGFDSPGCNQIDGFSAEGGEAQLNSCWGVLCPTGQKCVGGDCGPPGIKAPCEPCESGRDCALNAGCIPLITNASDFESRGKPACLTYCHDVACPSGFACNTVKADVDGKVTWHRVCFPEGSTTCPLLGDDSPEGFSFPGPICR